MFKALTCAAALLALSVDAGAAPERTVTLTTGSVIVPAGGGNAFICTAVNTTGSPLTVTLELVNDAGQLILSNTATPDPGRVAYAGANPGTNLLAGYCRVKFQGAPSAVRASMCIFQSGVCTSNIDAR
jgi:hypothetical protein